MKKINKMKKMKKMNKQGFTLVEIMIVVAIIGLLAAIGVPSILGAYKNAQINSMKRNIADVEKAKGVLTLPSESGMVGAISADSTTVISSGSKGFTNILAVLKLPLTTAYTSMLKVGTNVFTIGDMGTVKASYGGSENQ